MRPSASQFLCLERFGIAARLTATLVSFLLDVSLLWTAGSAELAGAVDMFPKRSIFFTILITFIPSSPEGSFL